MNISDDLLSQLLKDYKEPKDLIGEGGIFEQLQARLLQAVTHGELNHHLGYEKHDKAGNNSGNSRNGTYPRKIKTESGELEIKMPRDRNGTFSSTIIPKNTTRFDGFDKQIISLYASGLTMREIRDHVKQVYKTDVSPELISTVVDQVKEDLDVWRNRELKDFYCFIFLDAIHLKIKESGRFVNKAVYVAVGVDVEGKRDVLGLWIGDGIVDKKGEKKYGESAGFWLDVLNEIKHRGVEDVLIVCVDGLKGFPKAIGVAFPEARIQLCIVHMLRNSALFLSYKKRKIIMNDLKPIYTAKNEKEAAKALNYFEEIWGEEHPRIVKTWRENWNNLVPFLDYGGAIRKAIYTTNSIESLNMSLRRVLKTRPSFPNNDSVYKLLFLGLQKITQRWSKSVKSWSEIIGELDIKFPGRIPTS